MTQLPPSASRLSINLIGVAAYVATLFAALSYDSDMPFLTLFGLSIAALALPIVLLEVILLKSYRQPDVGWLAVKDPVDNTQVKRRVKGLNATLFALFLTYLILPEYVKPMYSDYLKLFYGTSLLIMGGGFLYINFIVQRLADKQDGFWQLGTLLSADRQQVHWPLLIEHGKRWLVKGFFLPLMVAGAGLYYAEFWDGYILYNNFRLLAPEGIKAAHSLAGRLSFATLGWNDYLLLAVFFIVSIDVLFGVLGYLLTLRVLNAHIRSTEPTLLGWLVCLICYPPFWVLLSESYMSVGSTVDWRAWLHESPGLFFAWGVLVFVFYGTYTLCSITQGLRASNLTYRGLITSGPYRYSKHPQYIAKWFGWLTMLVPFISPVGPFSAMRSMILLFAMGFLYYWRARTEENHLSNYPEYVAYAEWIDQHGVFRRVGKWFPYLRYSYERTLRSNSTIWQKKGA